MFDGVTKKLVSFITRTNFDDLPREIVDKVKLMLLDSIGCALGGILLKEENLLLSLSTNPEVIHKLALSAVILLHVLWLPLPMVSSLMH